MRITAALLLIGACFAKYAGDDAMTAVVKSNDYDKARKIMLEYVQMTADSDAAKEAFSPVVRMYLKQSMPDADMASFLKFLYDRKRTYRRFVKEENGMNANQIVTEYGLKPEVVEIVAPFLGEDQKLSLAEHIVLQDYVIEFNLAAVDNVIPAEKWPEICAEHGIDATVWTFEKVAGADNVVSRTEWVLFRLFKFIADGDDVITKDEYMAVFPETSEQYFNEVAQGDNEITWPEWLAFYTGRGSKESFAAALGSEYCVNDAEVITTECSV